MKWENLREFKCPHCGNDLAKIDGAEMVSCTHCRFVIDRSRFEKIIKHRRPNPGEVQKMKWQNLKDGRCPLDGELLIDGPGHRQVFRCPREGCQFGISEDKLAGILADPEHPTNKIYLKI